MLNVMNYVKSRNIFADHKEALAAGTVHRKSLRKS